MVIRGRTCEANVAGLCAMAEAVSRRPVSLEARLRCEVSLCGVWGGQTGSGTSCSQGTSVCLLASYRQALYVYFIHLPPILRVYSIGKFDVILTVHRR